MKNKELLSKIESVEKLASSSKLGRMLKNPWKYFNAILFREFVYKKTKKTKKVLSTTFFGTPMHILLPSSTDIYLTGGKSHGSEIRLAKYLIQELKEGEDFLDIGAHYGYFSLLASILVGDKGQIIAFEPAPNTFEILKKNQEQLKNIEIHNRAVSDEDIQLTFYEFPNLYSEYNTLDIEQFREEAWFKQNPPKEIRIDGIILDTFLSDRVFKPRVVKIDAEGAEFKVLNGMKHYLKEHSPALVMEYLSESRGNEAHQKAEDLLVSLGFTPHRIDENGVLVPLDSVHVYMQKYGINSDNIVFISSKVN